jgi:hypothetical protein
MVEIPSCYPDPCGLTCVILAGRLFYIFLDFLFLLCRKKMCMHGIYFFILCHHGEYSHGFLHTVDLLTWGLGFK